jgi:hypothetical protein
MKKSLFAGILAISLCVFSCTPKEDVDSNPVAKDVLEGYAQKGPYVNGASVYIAPLDAQLNQTGKMYTTTTSNYGSFEQRNIELVSNFVELKADGYY